MGYEKPRPGLGGAGTAGKSSLQRCSEDNPYPEKSQSIIAKHFAETDLSAPRVILRSDGAEVYVDAADYDRLRCKRWFPAGTDGAYAGRSETTGGTMRRVYMHREIMSPPPGCVVDHVNGNRLDNRRCNLRIASRSQNAANRGRTRNPSGFHGVCADPENARYQASVTKDGARFRGPWRKDADTAAHDYDALARGIHDKFATLNFPRPGERGIERPQAGDGAQ